MTVVDGDQGGPLERAQGVSEATHDPAVGIRFGLALRVPLFTAVTTGLGVGAHLLGGGQPPAWGTLALVLVAVALGWRVTTRAEQSLPRLLARVLGVQAAIHLVLSAPTSAAPASAAPPLAADVHDCAGAVSTVGHPSPLMWLAHGLAAVAVAVWLRRGEAALWRAVRRVVASLAGRPGEPLVVTRAPSTRVDAAGDARPDPILLLLGLRWRGPPRGRGPSHPLPRFATPY
ncbi:MAG: hypothetical protein ACM3ZF_16975 [Mycobacterium leprae]